jgi:stringent starvation protein B
MTTLFLVDFKEKKLIGKKNLDAEIPHPDQTAIEKLMCFTGWVDQGMISVRVNTKFPGVELPASIKTQLTATIHWSKKFKLDDFVYDEDGVRGTLSFSNKKFFTNLPWGSVWGIGLADGSETKEWSEDLPGVVVPE